MLAAQDFSLISISVLCKKKQFVRKWTFSSAGMLVTQGMLEPAVSVKLHCEACVNVTSIWRRSNTLMKANRSCCIRYSFIRDRIITVVLWTQNAHTKAIHQSIKARGDTGLSSNTPQRTNGDKWVVCYKRSVQTSMGGKINIIKPNKWQAGISGAMHSWLSMTQSQPC